MRRTELIAAANNIVIALSTANVREALLYVMRLRDNALKDSSNHWTMVLTSMRDYSISASRWGDTEKKISRLLKLDGLLEPATWQPMEKPAGARDRDADPVRGLWRTVGYVEEYLPLFVGLLAQSDASKDPDRATLRIVLVEDDDRPSTPERMIKMFDGVQALYEVCATLVDVPIHSVSVVACDSGSDKSFDFAGIAKAIECLKELILSVWDKVIYYREHKLEARVGAVAKALPIIEKIHELKQSGAMDPSQAEQLRRRVMEGASKLLESGIVTPEIQERSSYNPRQLMAPETKLLTAGPSASAPPQKRPSASPLRKPSTQDEEVVVHFIDEESDAIPEVEVRGKSQSMPIGGGVDLSRLTPDEQASLAQLLSKLNQNQTDEDLADSRTDEGSPVARARKTPSKSRAKKRSPASDN